jgi:hypothetical protein
MNTEHTRRWSVLLIGLILVAASLGMASAAPVKVVEGTPVHVRLMERVGSGDMTENAAVPMEVAEDVLGPSHEVLIAKGSPVVATIRRSSREEFLGKPGELAFSVEATHAINGARIPLRGSVSRRGENTAFFSPAALLARGRNVKLKKGSTYIVVVDRDTMVDPAVPSTAIDPPASHTSASASSGTSQSKRMIVLLANGDKISGMTDGLQGATITLVTAYGTLNIPASEVIRLSEW